MTLVAVNELKAEEENANAKANETFVKDVKEGSYETSKGKSKMIEEIDSGDDDMDEIDEHMAFMSRRFSNSRRILMQLSHS